MTEELKKFAESTRDTLKESAKYLPPHLFKRLAESLAGLVRALESNDQRDSEGVRGVRDPEGVRDVR